MIKLQSEARDAHAFNLTRQGENTTNELHRTPERGSLGCGIELIQQVVEYHWKTPYVFTI